MAATMTDQILEAPLLETERLILRGFQRCDFDAFCNFHSDPVIIQSLQTDGMSHLEIWEKFLRGPAFWRSAHYGVNWSAAI